MNSRYTDKYIQSLLCNIPEYTSNAFYGYFNKTNRKPRFNTVFKGVKDELKYDGVFVVDLTVQQLNDIEEMVRDTFDGIRESEF